MMRNFDTAIFDLDGTLVDSMRVWEEIDCAFLGKRGLVATAEYRERLRAMSFTEAAAFTIETFDLSDPIEKVIGEWNRMAEYEYERNIAAKPYAREYVEYLHERGVKIGLATASPRSLYEPVLKNTGMYDLFSAFVSSSEVKRGKGFPDVYLLAAERLRSEPGCCCVFEDILPGIVGAKAAGMNAVGVYDERSAFDRPAMEKLADLYIMDFSELMK